MHKLRRTIVVASLTAMAISALAAPSSALVGKGTIGVVNGIPGQRVDICINGKEIRGNVDYGGRTSKTINSGIKSIKVYKADPRKCKGVKVAQTVIDLGALAVPLSVLDSEPGNAGRARGEPALAGGERSVCHQEGLPQGEPTLRVVPAGHQGQERQARRLGTPSHSTRAVTIPNSVARRTGSKGPVLRDGSGWVFQGKGGDRPLATDDRTQSVAGVDGLVGYMPGSRWWGWSITQCAGYGFSQRRDPRDASGREKQVCTSFAGPSSSPR